MTTPTYGPPTGEGVTLIHRPVNEPPLVVIHPDGTVRLREGLTLDEASRAFWEYVGGENAALRDRLARTEARISTALHLTRSLDALDREDSHLPMNDRVLLNRILVKLGHYDAPTDGAAREEGTQ